PTWNYEEGGNLAGRVAAAGLSTPEPCKSGPIEGRGAEGQGYQAQGPIGAKAVSSTAPQAALPPKVAYDLSLEHPRCVYQLLKKHYSRYTPEIVERITGIPKDDFVKAAEMFTSIRK